MACSHITKQDFEDLKKLSAELAKDFNLVPNKQEQLIRLPRGGLVISTSAGNIQFGMPPETVKDSIIMGIDVPEIYVLPTNRFDFHTCLNVAEFEFPVYFNFFVRRKKVRLVCTEEAKQAILAVFQETLLGPTSFEGFEEEFDRRFDPDAMPDFYKEGQHFAKNPFKPGESLSIDTVTEFIIFDDQNIAQITEDIQVRKRDDTFEVLEKGKAVAIVPDSVELGEPPHKERHNAKEETKHDNRQPTSIEEIEDLQGITPSSDVESVYFVPPSFGVTILGNSHGFDPQGCTSGYVIWINGRGVMVDPPPFSIQRLKRMGVASRLIESIIISHCHGDHDAGVFQKVLDTQQIEIITTRTIMKSFIRKYSAILKMTPEKTASLFRFKPVVIGAPLYLNGAVFKFFYSLHSIPAIGFEVFSHEKSLYFSADTFYEPTKMQEMVTAGVMSKQRCESLCNNKWNHNLILHEAGVPPIHTPMKILSELPEDVKKRTMLVHVAAKDVPHDCGLKIAPQGLQNTIVLDPTPVDQLNLINVLDVVCSIDAFKNVPIRTMKDVIISADKEIFKTGKIIVDEGQIADKFYIIIDGIVRVLLSKPGQEFDRFYQVGDFFGESILHHKTRRLATAVAVTDVKLLVISKSDFIFFFGENKEILTKMNNLIQLRKYRVLQVLKQNSILSALSSSQKLHLETILQSHKVKANDQIWKKGETPEFAMLIYEGTVEVTYDSADFKEDEDNTDEFSVGVFISETQAMAENHKCKLSVKAMTDCHVFIIEKSDYLRFLSNNPKLNINLSGGEIFE